MVLHGSRPKESPQHSAPLRPASRQGKRDGLGRQAFARQVSVCLTPCPFSVTLLFAVATLLLTGCNTDSETNTPTPPVTSSSSTDPQTTPTVTEPTGPVWFRKSSETGIAWVHSSGVSQEKEFPAANGSGLGALDYDLDGRVDLYLACGCKFPIDLANFEHTDAFYRNLGDFRFADVTAQTDTGFNGYSAGVAVGDYDSDGFPDVYVACYGANVLYHNQGDGSFVRKEVAAGVAEESWATGAGFFDADNDGDLDLYICNYGFWSLETNKYCHADGNRAIRLFCSPKSIEPANDVYYENQGDGTFADRSQAAGFQQRAGRAQGVVMADLDGDHFIDVYLGNDLNANSLFMNNQDGTFRDETELSGVAYSSAGIPQAGMGVDAGDANGDGRMELIVTNFKGEYSTLYENRGPGLFVDVSLKRGVGRDTIPYVSWGTSFTDFDLDGWLDLLIVNGHVDPNRLEAGEDAPYRNPALLWRNDSASGNVGSFVGVHRQAGDYFSDEHSSRALLVIDLDDDGDFDFVSGNQDEPPTVVENLVRGGDDQKDLPTRDSVTIKLVGTSAVRDAIGSSLSIPNGERTFTDQITGGGSYLSNNDYRMILPVTDASALGAVKVRFNGSATPWVATTGLDTPQLEANGHYVVIEANDPSQLPQVWRIDDVR